MISNRSTIFQRQRRPVWIVCLALPLTVYLLPNFQTTFQEDLVLLVLGVYLLLRGLNDRRKSISEETQVVFTALLLGIPYGIGWLGLVRGYLDSEGRWLVIYPLVLMGGVLLRPPATQCACTAYRKFLILLMLLSWAVFFMAGCVAIFFHTLFDATTIPVLLSLLILACTGLLAPGFPLLTNGRNHVPLCLITSFAMLCVWSGNLNTWRLWYQAGRLERAWTPFKYDDPADIARAERKPYEAVALYEQVRLRILTKGDIPQYLNWPFFMQYRMAYQAMRKEDPRHCAQFLPVAKERPDGHVKRIKNLWHQEFLWTMKKTKPDYANEGLVWVDMEYSPKQERFLLLDRWGRVYIVFDDYLWMDWDPQTTFWDAVDLELVGDTYVVLRRCGEILSSTPLSLFDHKTDFPVDRRTAVDLEFTRDGSAAFVVNSFGEMCTWGTLPSLFPDIKKLRFDQPAIIDMELEPYNNGYYLLDIHGAVHSNHISGTPSIPHSSPPVPKSLLPYWSHLNMAVDMELDPLGRGIYIYNRLGEIFTIAVTPFLETYRPPKTYPHRGVAMSVLSDGKLYVLESNGATIQVNP